MVCFVFAVLIPQKQIHTDSESRSCTVSLQFSWFISFFLRAPRFVLGLFWKECTLYYYSHILNACSFPKSGLSRVWVSHSSREFSVGTRGNRGAAHEGAWLPDESFAHVEGLTLYAAEWVNVRVRACAHICYLIELVYHHFPHYKW